jgi:uncharacterized membrane protein YhaH (DUF805 family)
MRRLLGTSMEHAPVRLARLPFILAHVVGYALAFLVFQIIGFIMAKTGNTAYEMGDFAFALFLLGVSVVLLPVHVRRAHDLSWSAMSVFWFSILPSILRVVCFLVPLAFFAAMPNSLPTIMKFMPYIGLFYWFLNQVQMGYMVVLAFAPGTGTHNRFGDSVAKSFNMKNLYGFKVLGRGLGKKSPAVSDHGGAAHADGAAASDAVQAGHAHPSSESNGTLAE